jgi:hypothetical protein
MGEGRQGSGCRVIQESRESSPRPDEPYGVRQTEDGQFEVTHNAPASTPVKAPAVAEATRPLKRKSHQQKRRQ